MERMHSAKRSNLFHAAQRDGQGERSPGRIKISRAFVSSIQHRPNRVLSLVLIIAAIATFIHFIPFTGQDQQFTEFYILNESGRADRYPEQFAAGDPQHVIIGISNHEHRDVTYTVETMLLNMTFDPATNTSIIHQSMPLHSFTTTLSHNETKEFPYTFSITDTHFNRLQFLLFNETLPANSISGSDRINASYQVKKRGKKIF
jgi:uncharacterized membrane protein